MIAIHDVRVEFFGKPSHASGKKKKKNVCTDFDTFYI